MILVGKVSASICEALVSMENRSVDACCVMGVTEGDEMPKIFLWWDCKKNASLSGLALWMMHDRSRAPNL